MKTRGLPEQIGSPLSIIISHSWQLPESVSLPYLR